MVSFSVLSVGFSSASIDGAAFVVQTNEIKQQMREKLSHVNISSTEQDAHGQSSGAAK